MLSSQLAVVRKSVIAMLVVALLLSFLPVLPILAESGYFQTAASYNVCMIGDIRTATESTKFPDVSMNLRVVDSLFVPVINLTKEDIQIQENNSTPVYSSDLSRGPDAGADIYFVFDTGNRTNPLVVKKILGYLYDFFEDGVDTFTLISNKNASFAYLAKNVSSKEKLNEIIQNIPDQRNPEFFKMFASVEQLLKDVAPNNNRCDRPSFVFIVAGDTSFEGARIMGYDYSEYLSRLSNGKLFFIHNGSSTIQEYKNFSDYTNGVYVNVPAADQTSDFSRAISSLSDYRTTYDVTYRSINGGSGTHQLKLFYQGQELPIDGADTYSIQIDPPAITLTPHDTNILRVANKKTEEGYTFRQNTELIDVNIDWKGYPRAVTSAKLIVDSGNPFDVKIEMVNETLYRITWDISNFDQKGIFQPKIAVQLMDELSEGLSERVISGNTSVQIINRVPASLMTTWLLYGLYALCAAMIIAFLIWRKQITASIVKGGKSVGEAIRKTIVGNRNSRKNPIAVIVIIDGPQNLIGKELPIYAESINLGRDPSKSDLTFYGPESATSVSGLHCKLQRVGAGWQISAVSTSQSETFVDEQPIPFLHPVVLNDGQKVRMGYLAQQPVEFEFHVKEDKTAFISDPRKTNALTSDSGLRTPSFVPNVENFPNFQNPPVAKQDGGLVPPPFTPSTDSDRKDGSIFDEFR